MDVNVYYRQLDMQLRRVQPWRNDTRGQMTCCEIVRSEVLKHTHTIMIESKS